MKQKRMSFIVPDLPAFQSEILKSQLFPKASMLSKMGWKCQFIGSDTSKRCTQSEIDSLTTTYGFSDVRIFPRYPEYSSFSSLSSMRRSMSSEVSAALYSWQPRWGYFRSIFDFRTYKKALEECGGRSVLDVRAALSNEVKHKHGGIKGTLKGHIISHYEIKAFKDADYLLCVSENMKAWIAKASGRSDAVVIPCCADEERFFPNGASRHQRRTQIGWDDRSPVIVYAGGASYWQRPDDIANLLSGLKKNVPDLKVLILTNNVDFFTECFSSKLPFEDFHIRKVSHQEMPSWLNAADLGIVLRHDLLLNNVSSPIKIGEYLATGLAVICTNGIGDYSSAISQAGAGYVLDEHSSCETLAPLLINRDELDRCRERALALSSRFSKSHESEIFLRFLQSTGLL